MANVENLEQRILETVGNEDAFAIALTGEWGVGKTHLWDELRGKNEAVFSGKKYAYVSLFGLDSLASLKSAIAIEVHKSVGVNDSIWKKDILKPIKKFLSSLTGSNIGTTSDVRIGLNLGNNIITSVVFSHLKNTLVCLDDIERKSNGLPMSEVMGLVNYLKNERKCQVLMIMHDEESDDKVYFDKHKEKVFDEVLILDDNLDILENFITDELTLSIMQLFYRKLGIKNLRFYNKVFNSYQQIINSIDSLSKTSKEHILKNLLVIRWIDEFQPEIILDNGESFFKVTLDLFLDENNPIRMSDDRFSKQSKELKAFRNYLNPFYPLFLFDDWAMHIISMLNNHDISKKSIQELIERDALSESKLQNELAHEQVMNEFHSLKLQHDFCERLYSLACARIQKSELNNISFYCDIFENSDQKDLAEQLESRMKEFIKYEIKNSQSKPSIDNWYLFGKQPYDRFYDFIEKEIKNHQGSNIKANIISSIFLKFHDHNRNGWNSSDKDAISMIDKDILEELIWADLDDERYRRQFIHSILKHPVLNEIEGKREEVRKWIVELLKERIEESSGSEIPIKMWLSSTKNLTKDLF